MKIFFQLLRLLKPFTGEVILSIMMGIATVGSGIGLLGSSAFLIASAALHPSIADLQIAIVGVRFFGISRAIFRYLERVISHSVNLRVLSKMREIFYRKVASSPPEEFLTYQSGDLLDRVMGNLEVLENFYVRVISPFIVSITVCLGVSFFVGAYALPLGVILGSGLVINGIFLPAIAVAITKNLGGRMAVTKKDLSSRMTAYLYGLEDLQSNNADFRWIEEIDQLGKKSGKIQMQYSRLNGLNLSLGLIFLNFTTLALLWVAIPLVRQSSIDGVFMAVILLIGMASFEAVANLPQAATNLTACLEAGKRFFNIGRESISLNRPIHKSDTTRIPSIISFKSLYFEYEQENEFQLEDISFDLELGKITALVGPSGSGKSSLVNLLLQFWQPKKGHIYFDDFAGNHIDPTLARSYFAVISQRSHLFSTSLKENLLLGDAEANEDRLHQVLSYVELNDWVASLPHGLDTWMGDDGLRMSGGERQRVFMARALLMNRPYLILDEPTENLDPINSTKIMQMIFRLFSDRGIFWITHDVLQIDAANEILFLDHGKITERGSYERLMNSNSKIRALHKIQMQRID